MRTSKVNATKAKRCPEPPAQLQMANRLCGWKRLHRRSERVQKNVSLSQLLIKHFHFHGSKVATTPEKIKNRRSVHRLARHSISVTCHSGFQTFKKLEAWWPQYHHDEIMWAWETHDTNELQLILGAPTFSKKGSLKKIWIDASQYLSFQCHRNVFKNITSSHGGRHWGIFRPSKCRPS